MRRWGAGLLAVVTVGAAVWVVPSARAVPPVTVFAHRGGSLIAPENTLGAFRQAHELFGARGVWLEMDTQLSADGHPVVIHDDTLDRTTSCTGTVISHTLAELRQCDARKTFPTWEAEEWVPALEEVLVEGRSAGWRLMVELKDIPGEANFDATGNEVADAVVGLVHEVGFPADRLIIQSFWPPALDRVEALDPSIPTALLTTATLPGAPAGVGFTLSENAAFATARGYEVSAPDHTSLDLRAPVVSLAHALGRQVVVWTPNTASEIETAAAAGVDGVITDDPHVAYAVLG